MHFRADKILERLRKDPLFRRGPYKENLAGAKPLAVVPCHS